MNEPRPQTLLRPLGIGEVLDRAVTLCVRNFVPLSLIFMVYAVPLAVVGFYASQDFASILQTITRSVTPGAGRPVSPQALSRALGNVHPNGWYGLLLALTFFVSPVPTAALITATTQAYLGRATSFAQAYRTALRRWPALLGLNILYGLTLVGLYIALVFVLVLVITAVAFLTVAMRGLGITVAVVMSVLGIVTMMAFFIVVALAFQVSYFTCVVEGTNVMRSYSLGVSRVFKGVGLRRTLLVGVVFVTIAFGIALVSSLGAMLLDGLTHTAFVGTVYATLVRIATAAFTTAFIGIFYFDLRVREEGLDLQLAARQSVAAPPSE